MASRHAAERERAADAMQLASTHQPALLYVRVFSLLLIRWLTMI